jgi:hypothetical protein
MLIKYVDKRFGRSSREVIEQANVIIEEYREQGFDLTLRQLYYQFVSRGLIANRQKEYKRLGSIINDARLAGLVSWEAIVDRTRNLQSESHWTGPREIVETCAKQFRIDRWEDQKCRVEVWIEKDALTGVIAGACRDLDVPYFSCRGYTSQSEMWSAARRLRAHASEGQVPLIIHLGDHDPSGIDMTRDITERLRVFRGGVLVERIALNMNQVEEYTPPPNPAKLTDSRVGDYIKNYGEESWELDALDPKVIDTLIRKTIGKVIDKKKWDARIELENEHKATLAKVARKFQ